MPANGLNLGIDTKITISDADGVQNFAILQSFSSAENATTNEKVAMDGITRFPKMHMGWTGKFDYQRNSPLLDQYIARQEAGYYLGVDQLPATITQTITENDGSVTQWSFTNVVLTLENAGDWNSSEIVMQTFSFKASRKQQLA